MTFHVLDFLQENAKRQPEKLAVIDEHKSISYQELLNLTKGIGSRLSQVAPHLGKAPVGVFMDKGIDALSAFFGILSAGATYVMLNPELPQTRLEKMLATLDLAYLITDQAHEDLAQSYFQADNLLILKIEDLVAGDSQGLETWPLYPANHVDTNPLYINFTSGSTGTPKGIAVSHRSVIDFIQQFNRLFAIGADDILANQAPFDFDVSVKDIYASLFAGATLVIVPKRLFSAPVELMDFLVDHEVTTMIWAVSALALLSAFHTFDYKVPTSVNKILFSGEVMPLKHLKEMQKHLPEATLVNLYGPTEITCNCTYHVIDPQRDYSGGIPIGQAFPNEEVFLLDEANHLVLEPGQSGQVCVRGTALALGYYNNPEQTAKAFVQNPLNTAYPELIYQTGDLAYWNEQGELVFNGRKDFQIKYQGHRIELEEIERAILAVPAVQQCACVFDEKKGRLRAAYSGPVESQQLFETLQETLPVYMIPSKFIQLDSLPLNKNGKIDRAALKEVVGGRRRK